ncbi:MAG: hypothetical protein UHD05_07800 [Ruminococcus sp.]|nr:hypothetical protein [Ruminococcus sp.]
MSLLHKRRGSNGYCVLDYELNDISALVIYDSATSHYDVSYEDISIVGA